MLRTLNGDDVQNALAARTWLGSGARQRTASVNYSGAHADVARGFLHESQASAVLLQLAELKRTHGILFVVVASVTAGALIPELFLIFFFQRGRPSLRNLHNLLFTVPLWRLDGTLVDLLYRNQAAWFGDVATLPVIAEKICVDQFGYNPIFAAPFGVLTYEWKNSGISLQPIRDLFTRKHYRDKIIPTLLATSAIWIPLMAIIYSLPLALTFCVLLLTYMTNRFAGQIEADSPLALATTEVK